MNESTAAEFWGVEIVYHVRDHLGDQDGDPNEAATRNITADVSVYPVDDGEMVHVGELRMELIDLPEDDEDLFEILDSHSGEHTEYYGPAVNQRGFAEGLLIVETLRIDPTYRGHGIGPHVLARAICTWGRDALTLMIAAPVEGPRDLDTRRSIGAKLRDRWCAIGVKHVGDTSEGLPILFCTFDDLESVDALHDACRARPRFEST